VSSEGSVSFSEQYRDSIRRVVIAGDHIHETIAPEVAHGEHCRARTRDEIGAVEHKGLRGRKRSGHYGQHRNTSGLSLPETLWLRMDVARSWSLSCSSFRSLYFKSLV
jgi:hypothetical protein